MPKSPESLWTILERTRKSPRISENFGNASNPFLRRLNDLWNLKIFGNSSKVFSRCFYNCLKFSENLGNLRKCSEIFGNFRKTSKTVQKKFSDVFMIFQNFRKILGNLRKCSEIFGNDIRMWSEMLAWDKWRARCKNGLSDDFQWLFKILGNFGVFFTVALHSRLMVHSK